MIQLDYELIGHTMEDAPVIKAGEAFPANACTNLVIAFNDQMFFNTLGQAFKVKDQRDFQQRYTACYTDQKSDSWAICHTTHAHGEESRMHFNGRDLPGAATQEIAQLLIQTQSLWLQQIGTLFFNNASVYDKAAIQSAMARIRKAPNLALTH